MIEKILDRMKYVKEIKADLEWERKRLLDRKAELSVVEQKCFDLEINNNNLKSRIRELESIVGYVVNEGHAIMADKTGRKYIPITGEYLEKYKNGAEVEVKKTAPVNGVMIFAKRRKG